MISTQLGSYELLEEVGRGGMATVYRAYQATIDRQVAIKVIQKHILDDENALERFQREARLVARLEHAHILPVYDFNGTYDPPYIVMRYLDGGTLKDILKRGMLPYAEITSLIRQIASALDYAHRQGVVHRDVKPSNIMIDLEGNAFVTDFGIARINGGSLHRTDDEITKTGTVVGTPDYMSPEQAMGSDAVDHRSDIYSLGVMLFQMVTGRLPFTADLPMGVIIKQIHDAAPSAVAVNSELSEEVDFLLWRAMAKKPEERFATAADFARAVTEVFEGSTPMLRRQNTGLVTLKNPGNTWSTAHLIDTASQHTPTEQNKVVTVVHVDAAEYAQDIEEENGTEAVHSAMSSLWEALEQVVKDHGGKTFTRTENTLLALWGVDQAHENDAERAIDAALEMQAALKRVGSGLLQSDEPLPLHIGINTGTVLLTPVEGSSSYTASGATLSLSSRLAQSAEGIILVSHDTFSHVRGVFDMDAEDPIRVRGREEKLPVYSVVGKKARAFRLSSRGVEGVETQMIGREAELKQLQNAFFAAIEDRETQVATILGDAGIGKSRLLYEFTNWVDLRPERLRFFQGRATTEMTNSPYALVRDVLSFRFEIYDSDSPALLREKMEQGIAKLIGEGQDEMAHRIGQLVGFDFADSPHVSPLLENAEQFVEIARWSFVHLFATLGQQRPILIQLEDIHWADDASLDLLNELVNSQREIPMLIVAVARPLLFERRPGWGAERDLHQRVELQPLPKRDSRNLVAEILKKMATVPKTLRDLIVERADGNPYYMEELVKVLIEDRVIRKQGETWTAEIERLDHLRIPPTLVGLLQARLDSLLLPERVVLQRAVVIGRIFWDSALTALGKADTLPLEDSTIQKTLKHLVEREFLYLRENSSFAGSTEYAFGNNVLRDVVYESLLKRQQRAYHAAAADWLVTASGERVSEYQSLIAEHYEKAGENVKAADFLYQFAHKAEAITAYDDALTALRRAQALLQEDTTPEATAVRIKVQVYLGMVYSARGAYHEAKAYAETALCLARETQDQAGIMTALGQLGRICLWQGAFDEGRGYLLEALPIARQLNDLAGVAYILRQLGNIQNNISTNEETQHFLEESLQIARQIGDQFAIGAVLNSLGIRVYILGDARAAMPYFEEGLQIGRKMGNRRIMILSLLNMGIAELQYEDYASSRKHSEEALQLSGEIKADSTRIIALNTLGSIAVMENQDEVGREFLRLSLNIAQEIDDLPVLLVNIIDYARLAMKQGDPLRAAEMMEAALAHPSMADEYYPRANKLLAALREQLAPDQLTLAKDKAANIEIKALVKELLNA